MAPMTPKDVDWVIDTLRREEDIIREFKRQAFDRGDWEAARTFEQCVRELFGVRQLLEQERHLLRKLVERAPDTMRTINEIMEEAERRARRPRDEEDKK